MSKKKQFETIIIYYSGDGFDAAIEAELQRRGMKRGSCAIIALPEIWRQKGMKKNVVDDL